MHRDMVQWRVGAPDTHMRAETERAILTICASAPPFWWMVRLRRTSHTKPPGRQGCADTLDEAKRATVGALHELLGRQ